MRVIVTGGSGFIGTRLVEKLVKKDYEVVILDTKNSSVFTNLTVQADVRDKKMLGQMCQGADVIYNLAAEHADDVWPTSLYYEVNVIGARNLVSAALENQVQHIVFTSTVALYGLNIGIPNESFPARPFNDYGKSKWEAEKVFEEWAKANAARSLTIIRPATIFGEGNRGNVYNLLKQIASDNFVFIGKGENEKSMAYVGNLVEFLVEIGRKAEPGIHIYNYADKPDIDMNTLVSITRKELGKGRGAGVKVPYFLGILGGYGFDLLAKLTGQKFPVSAVRVRKFCANTIINTDKLEKSGYVRKYTLEEGLKRMIDYEFRGRNSTQNNNRE